VFAGVFALVPLMRQDVFAEIVAALLDGIIAVVVVVGKCLALAERSSEECARQNTAEPPQRRSAGRHTSRHCDRHFVERMFHGTSSAERFLCESPLAVLLHGCRNRFGKGGRAGQ
jgi:hypothetical protein